MLKICRVCDSIIGELETDEFKMSGLDHSLEIVGNTVYTLCSNCMRDLDMDRIIYFH